MTALQSDFLKYIYGRLHWCQCLQSNTMRTNPIAMECHHSPIFFFRSDSIESMSSSLGAPEALLPFPLAPCCDELPLLLSPCHSPFPVHGS
mmetsp:Transcript_15644/g.43760  ORF Transcript_15644/g.43760 Transcript_15644/m.43760 type:complete len:91 (+) Transcript_15644:103-375(+)